MASTTTEFSYFDQFPDVTIYLTPYFSAINTDQPYTYSFTNVQPVQTTLKNLFDQVDLVNNFTDISFFTSYSIADGERPENVSNNFYNTQNNWWILAIFNNMKNIINDWIMSEPQLQTLSDIYYSKEGKYSRATYYNLLFERNEIHRNILVLKPIYVNDVISAFRNEIEQLG
jgi:hypothetical protein